MSGRADAAATRKALRAGVRAAYVYGPDDESPEQAARRVAPPGMAKPAEVRRWALADDWPALRAEVKRRQRAQVPATAAQVADERQRKHIEALERLGNDAWALMQGMRPRSWEAAATVYVRCIELLNQFERARIEEGPAAKPRDADALLADANLPPLSEQALDEVANILLRTASQNPPDATGPLP